MFCLRSILLCLSTLSVVYGAYPCLCTYTTETSVYKARSNKSGVIGYMYEFDCKPTFPVHDDGTSNFYAVQFEKQIGYVEDDPGYLSIESCPGTLPTSDLVTTVSAIAISATSSTPTPKTTPTTTMSTTTTTPTTSPTTTKPSPTTAPTTSPTLTTAKTTSATTTTPTPTSTPTTTPTPTTIMSTSKTPSSNTPTSTTPTTAMPITTTPTPIEPTHRHFITHETSTYCPPGWAHLYQYCYDFHLSSKATYDEARARCFQSGAHLAIVDSDSNQRMISSILGNYHVYRYPQLSNHRLATAVWIGAFREGHHWVWDYGPHNSSTPLNYHHWSNIFPHHSSNDKYACAAMVGSENSHWVDFSCDWQFYYICQRDAQVPTHYDTTSAKPHTVSQTTVTLPAHGCPANWTRYHNSCYQANLKEHQSQPYANMKCSQLNAHLAFVDSHGEQQFLENFIKSDPEFGRLGQNTAIWIGGTFVDNKWYWMSPTTQKTLIGFTHWGHTSVQPNNGLDCTSMVGTNSFKWDISHCYTRQSYICERPLHQQAPVLTG